MAETSDQESPPYKSSEYLERGLRIKGLGSWQSIYLQFLEMMRPASLLEAGAGSPVFLKSLGAGRRVAVDLENVLPMRSPPAALRFSAHNSIIVDLSLLGKFEPMFGP